MHTPTLPEMEFGGFDGVIKSLLSGLPEWAKQASSWISESPGWAKILLQQTHLGFEITLNDQMILNELKSGKPLEACTLYRMSRNSRFHLYATPGTQKRLHIWLESMPEYQRAEQKTRIDTLMEKITEASTQAMQHWDSVRNLFPIIGNPETPFLALTFRMGDAKENQPSDIPDPSTFRIWDLTNTGKIISRLQQGAVTFYLCELNLPTLATLLTQVTTVFALSIVKWMGKTLQVLAELLKGSLEQIKKIPKEILLSVLGVFALSLLIPGVRNQMGEWLQKSSAGIKEIWHQLLTWLQTWLSSLEDWMEWLSSLGMLGGLLGETVWTDLKNMVVEMLAKGPEGKVV